MARRIKHVYGNLLRIAMPLEVVDIRTEDGEVIHTKTEFTPTNPMTVVLKKGLSKYVFNPVVEGNVLTFEDPGTLPVGVYEIELLSRGQGLIPLRYMARSVIEIVDATIDAGIEAGVEFDAESYTLDGGIFLFAKGDKGDGIAGIDVVESDEDDGYNVITITLTTGEEVSFNVKNGSKGYGISPETQQAILEGLERIKGLPVHRFLSESEYEALVNADQVDPDTIYLTYEDE
jgi:hypothetical protein